MTSPQHKTPREEFEAMEGKRPDLMITHDNSAKIDLQTFTHPVVCRKPHVVMTVLALHRVNVQSHHEIDGFILN